MKVLVKVSMEVGLLIFCISVSRVICVGPTNSGTSDRVSCGGSQKVSLLLTKINLDDVRSPSVGEEW